MLGRFKAKKNCVECCNAEGLMRDLELQQAQLELCEKALADYMESKRRMFPRFYFVSTADLLDILSNGNNPVRIMQHMSKCFQVRRLCPPPLWCESHIQPSPPPNGPHTPGGAALGM